MNWYNDQTIEDILFDYPLLKAEATIDSEALKNLFPSCVGSYSGEPHGSGISNTTANLGIKRADGTLAIKRVRAIEIAFDALNGECKEFVKLYYFEKRRKYYVCTDLNISERQFFRIRRESLNLLARLLLKENRVS